MYKESNNVCVIKLKNDNKICVNVACYSVCVLLDTGSTISIHTFHTLRETIQRILLGEATLSFDDNEHINVVSENGMATTVQRMDERLDKLEDLLKSCQLS